MATWINWSPRQAAAPSEQPPLYVEVHLSAPDKRSYNRNKDRAFKLKGPTTCLRILAPDHKTLRDTLNAKFRELDVEFHPSKETHGEDGVAGLSIESLVDAFEKWDRLGPRLTALGYKTRSDDNGRTTLMLLAKCACANAGESTASVEKVEGGPGGAKGVEQPGGSSLKARRGLAFNSILGLWPREEGVPYSWQSRDVPKWVRSMILQSYKKALEESGVTLPDLEHDLHK